MSRLIFYITLSLALHFVAVLPLLVEQFSGAYVESAAQVEQRVLSIPMLTFKSVSKPAAATSVQTVKPAVVEKQPKPEPKPKPKPKPAVKQVPVKPIKKPPVKADKTELRQQARTPDASKMPDAGQPQHAQHAQHAQHVNDKPLDVEKPSQVARTQSSMKEEVISKKPRFARPPAAPVYPAQARRQQQGTVWVDVRLDARGQQVELQVLRSSGVKSLDQAALAAVKKWQFLAELQNGIGVPSRVHIPIEFAIAAKP